MAERIGTTLAGRLDNSGPGIAGAGSPFSRLILGTIESANAILSATSRDVEEEAERLSTLFNRLSETSHGQVGQLQGLVAQFNVVEHEGQTYQLTDLPRLLEQALDEVSQRVTVLSKQGVSLIYSLDAIIEQMQDLDSCVTEIEGINRQGRLLSLNAQIEAGRTGALGAGFQVVATEMHNMSVRIDALSERMRENIDKVRTQVEEVIQSIRTEYNQLSDIGGMDLSAQADAKTHVKILMDELLRRDDRMTGALDDSASLSGEIHKEIRDVVISMQFQDRMKQRTEAVVAALDTILEFVRGEPQRYTDQGECEQVSRAIVNTISLSDVRKVFAEQLLDENVEAEPAEDASDDSSIELF